MVTAVESSVPLTVFHLLSMNAARAKFQHRSNCRVPSESKGLLCPASPTRQTNDPGPYSKASNDRPLVAVVLLAPTRLAERACLNPLVFVSRSGGLDLFWPLGVVFIGQRGITVSQGDSVGYFKAACVLIPLK
jgi:hypothetical protein